MWVLGLGFLWWPLLLLRTLGVRRRSRPPQFLPAAIVLCLALSLLVAVLRGAEFGRVLGAGYNIVVWVSLLALTTVTIDWRSLSRGIAQLAGLQSIAVLVALATHPLLSELRLPAAYVLPGAIASDPAFESFTTVRLVRVDYFGETVLRAAGFFGNSTWAGALAALGILVTPALLRGASRRAVLGYGALLALDAVTLYLSYSRNTWLGLAAAAVAAGVLVLWRRQQWYLLTALAATTVGAAVYVISTVDFTELFANVNSVREGSLDARTAIYSLTWQAVVDSPFPLLGSGVKERVPGLVASLGTHGTYLGLLYRGGWLAVVLLVLWLGLLALRAWRAGTPLALGGVVFATVWFVAEDLDAGHLAPLGLVVALAVLGGGTGSRSSVSRDSPRSVVELPTP
ncbi:O-antigen ligase like membrane protein [Geodermatophilus telluris]|uniref:O-antigen ligase like membrane protein n=2 Tax=Geodermatophilus telluris TaxID=1190417 RepID=A0A1G6L8G7_9ACTN|nr:O-antigen ligase like membrane protein [Geodermatophilus telluris]